MVAIAGPPYDLRAATRASPAVVDRLKSATFLLDTRASALSPSVDAIAQWIPVYAQWFEELCGIAQGRGAHHLYDRELSFVGDGVIAYPSDLLRLAGVVRPLGFAFSVSATAEEVVTQATVLQELLESGLVTSVGVVFSPGVEVDYRRAVAAMEGVVARGVSLGIVGDVKAFRRHVFSSRALSAADLTWYPSPETPFVVEVREPVRQCHSRLRLHITSSGDIFPCLGLVGIEGASLGNIRDPISRTGLSDQGVLSLLDHWHRHGPDISVPASSSSNLGLPVMCQLHRDSLTM